MKLKSISARNFKGQSFDEPLFPLTVLVGQNFSGKTARTDAIRLLLLGHLPELGKTERATFGLSSGKEMEVSGVFDNGLTIRRRFYLKGDTVKVEEEIPQAIADCGQLAVMLNAEEYFALSDQKRVEYVFANIALGEEWNSGSIALRVGEVAPSYEFETLDEPNPQRFIEENIETATEKQKAAKIYADRMEKTVQGLAGLRLSDPTGGADIATLDARHAKLSAAINELHALKATKAADYSTMIAARGRRASIKEELAKVEHHRQKRAGLVAAVALVTAQLAEIPDSSVTMETLLSLAKSNDGALAEARREFRELMARIAEDRQLIRDMDLIQVCPYCGAAGDGWKTLKLAELNTAIAKAEARCAELDRTGRLAKDALTIAQADIEKLKQVDRRIDALQHEHRQNEREIGQMDAILARVGPIEEELAKLEPDNTSLEAAVQMVQTELNVKNDELRTLEIARRAVMGRANDLQRLAQAEEERDKAKSEVEIAGLVLKKLREIQSEMVEAAFMPLLEDANSFFGRVLPSPLAYHKKEIGTWRGGVWVGHHTFSGVEKLLTYAAIQSALAIKSPVRIVILDEMLRAQGETFTRILESMLLAVKRGRIDGFVGIIPGTFENYRHLAEMGCDLVEITG